MLVLVVSTNILHRGKGIGIVVQHVGNRDVDAVVCKPLELRNDGLFIICDAGTGRRKDWNAQAPFHRSHAILLGSGEYARTSDSTSLSHAVGCCVHSDRKYQGTP